MNNVIPLAPVAQAEVQKLDDARMGEYIAEKYLRGKFLSAPGLGWLGWDGRKWEKVSDARVLKAVKDALLDFHMREGKAGADVQRLTEVTRLLSVHRMKAIVTVAQGELEVDTDQLDAHPDLLNCANGVVDLRTGELSPHDPDLLLTRVTPIKYRDDAHHPDWETALEALPPEVCEWMQVRFGQAATGHATPDDLLPVMQGGGSNGKSTMLAPIMRALGDFAVPVPDRVLLAKPGDHPTELMTLRGARLAVIEETPEARHLSVKRLKDVLGTDPMTARYIAKNNVSWHPTHSLFLSSNYAPAVSETDHGTWRRLALVKFPYTFRRPKERLVGKFDKHGDPTLRDRLKRGDDGVLESVLVWLVDGALRWYAEGQIIPPAPDTVESDTRAWRAESDLVMAFLADVLVKDPARHARRTDVYAAFTDWCDEHGHAKWSDKTFTARFGQHDEIVGAGIHDGRPYATDPGLSPRPGLSGTVPDRFRAWMGVRFRTPGDTD